MKKKKNNKGFSLVELIVVIAIMAVLVGVLAPQFIGYVAKSRVSTDIQNAQEIAQAIAVQISDDEASGTTTAGFAIPTTSALVSGISTVVGGTPEVKVHSTYQFYYAIDADANVTITVSDGTTTVQLYPSVTSGSDWDK